MPPIRAIKNHIIFQFENEIVRKSDTGRNRTQFSEKTDWGFEISSYDESTKSPQWAKVISVGPLVIDDITHGSRILIEALQWTEVFNINGISYWRTDDMKVMALDEDFQPQFF